MKKYTHYLLMVVILLFYVRSNAEELRLTVGAAIETSLSNNLDIRIEKFTPKTARENLTVAEAAFDPAIFGEASIGDEEARVNGADLGTTTNTYTVGGSKRFNYGTDLSVDLSMYDNEFDSDTLSDEHTVQHAYEILGDNFLSLSRGRTITVNGLFRF